MGQQPRTRKPLFNGCHGFIGQYNLGTGLGGGLVAAMADIFDLYMLDTHIVGWNAFHLPSRTTPHLLPLLLAYRTGFFRLRQVVDALLRRQMLHSLHIPPSLADMPRGSYYGPRFNDGSRRRRSIPARRDGNAFRDGILGCFQWLLFQKLGEFESRRAGTRSRSYRPAGRNSVSAAP